MTKSPNRLINEKSPYLLQHAYNPVDWQPWDEEAFERARKEDKPIFLSIGYSTCHWCHVMEKESFEDRDVARLMNETFISIKVDREERPDLDHVYMMVCQMLTGSGGWPLTILMTPQKKPFFAGTYIPKSNRFGNVGMIELIPHIKRAWETKRDELIESSEKITGALRSIEEIRPGRDMGSDVLEKAYQELAGSFDEEHGGFGKAPKFPTPHNLLFLLRHWKRSKNQAALLMVEKSLRQMRQGGMYDQIGFGFHRYSTDRNWLVPHFEKMLYDQALLALAYLEAYQATGEKDFGDTAEEIFTYVLRDMTAPDGGFYSAEDADSEGEEGKFYVWEEEEIRSLLETDEADLIIKTYHIERGGNFRDEASGKNSGANIMHLRESLISIAENSGIPIQELKRKLYCAGKILFERREERQHPHKDDKILTDWNGLMIAALARGAQVLGIRKYIYAAVNSVDLIMGRMRRSDGRLLHRYRNENASITANVDDYSFLIWGLIELYEATFEPRYLRLALEMNQDMISHFWDVDRGGLYFTPDDGEDLIVRKKELYDGAVPSGNSVSMLNMLRLARFTGRPDLEEKAAEIGRAFSNSLGERPSAFTYFMTAVDFTIGPTYEVVIAGRPEDSDTQGMIKALRKSFIPNKVAILRPLEEASPEIDGISGFLKDHVSIDGRATAYVCLNNSCKAPTTDVNEMMASII